MVNYDSSGQTMIEEIRNKTNDLLTLVEYRLGKPPNMSYLSAGYIGSDKTMRAYTETIHYLIRMNAIIWHNANPSDEEGEYDSMWKNEFSDVPKIKAEDITFG